MFNRVKIISLLTIISLVCLTIGMIFFLIKRDYLIVQFTFTPSVITTQKRALADNVSHNKQSKAFFWKNDQWHDEQVNIIWHHDNTLENVKNVTEQWLILLKEEDVLPRHLHLESVALSTLESEGYLSFSHSLFSQELLIIEKWNIIQSLLKTIEQVQLPLHSIRLLCHNQEIKDKHLDLSQALPIPAFQTR